MEKLIPLHSLVIVVTSTITSDFLATLFPKHEIITTEGVCRDLVGSGPRPDLAPIINGEIKHRVALKLSLGERVVLHGSYLTKESRMVLAMLADRQGASLLYLVDNINLFDADITSGDGGVADVVLVPHNILRPVIPFEDDPFTAMSKKYNGITVVGDIHGNLVGLTGAINWAQSRNHYLYFLGDVLSYGNETLKCLSVIHRLVMGGEASFVVGNHERKIARYLQQQRDEGLPDRPGKLSEGNQVTIDAIEILSVGARQKWIGKFRALLARSVLVAEVGHVTLTHAAIHPSWWRNAANQWEVENYALYGEIDRGAFTRRLGYKWVDSVPSGEIVLVGHDRRSTVPVTVRGRLGGSVVFLDTGAGKSGNLSTADLRFVNGGLSISNFNCF